jgi:hypothetical protein
MLELKSNISEYLLNNNFTLKVDGEKHIFNHVIRPSFTVHIIYFDDFTTISMKSKLDDYEPMYVDRLVIKTLDNLKFLLTNCTRSPLYIE